MHDVLPIRLAAVVGATGSLGRFLVAELLSRSIPVRAIARKEDSLRTALAPLLAPDPAHRRPLPEITPCDVRDPDATFRALAACDLVFHAIGLPLTQFPEHPKLARTVSSAARRQGARVVLATSYWSHDPILRTPVAETATRSPIGAKCRARKEQEEVVLSSGGAVCVLPDFYGPGARSSLLNDLIAAVSVNRAVRWPGPPDAERDFILLADAARLMVSLALRREAYPGRWNIPGSGITTPRQIAEMTSLVCKTVPRFKRPPLWLVQLIGLFSPTMREVVELLNIYSRPAVLDARKLRALLPPWKPTDYTTGVRLTLDALARARSHA